MRSPFIARREGRYVFRARWPACVGAGSLRIALRTGDYRLAVRRAARLASWFLSMKSAAHLAAALEALAPKLFELAIEPIVTDDQYVEASALRLSMMRVCLGLSAAGIEPESIVPGLSERLLVFQREYVRAYGEREADQSVAGQLAGRRRELASLATNARPAPTPVHTAGPAPGVSAAPARLGEPASPAEAPSRRLSDLLARFLAYKRQEAGDGRAESEVGPIVRFAIAFWGDPAVTEITPEQIVELKQALPEIPTPRGFTQVERADLFFRYCVARDGDWRRVVNGETIRLKRPAANTLKGRYKLGLDAFFTWAIEHKFVAGPAPDFAFVTRKNPGKRKRDAFQPDELAALLSTPAFTGCASLARCWEPGDKLYQSVFYWAILICVFSGLRPGEISQLRCRDLQPLYGHMHFRFARTDGRDDEDDDAPLDKHLKSDNAYRWAPVHPLLIRLGLLARRDAIVAAQIETRFRAAGGRARLSVSEIEAIELTAQDAWLFPDWKVYVRKTGVVQWSQALTKIWQYAQEKYDLTRRGLTLYSARHTYKGFIDDLNGLSERSRRVLMGHSTEETVPQQYGPKRITEAQMEVVLNLSNDTITQVAAILIRAKERAEAGELRVIEAWRKDMRGDDAGLREALAARAEWR